MRCDACGADNPGTAKFCGECGTRLVARERREERKVVSVLFADLVGFTSRSEQLDVEDVRGTLAPFHASLRKVLEGFGGTVEKFIGDAVMAVFGAPVAHEDDAERAVRAGLAIRDTLADLGSDLHVRVGINTGEALVSIGVDASSGEGMVAGDVVNTAARLQSAAPVDGVLVGEVTFRAAERQIVFAAHASIDAKGKSEPVACWMAVEPRSLVPLATRESNSFVGRERERRRLIDAFEECRTERRVQLVTIVGVPGIGKSRLVEELRAYVEADASLTTWRRGHVLSYGTGIAFFALAEIVKQECGILDSDDVHVAATKLDAAIVARGLEGADARWVRNQVRPLVGLDAAADGSGQSEAFAGWRLFFEAMGAASPSIIILEDLHWADDALLDFVDGLVDRVGEVPLLIVVTARPELLERRPDWAGGKTNALTIGLQPLSSEHTTALIGEIIDRSLLPLDTEAVLLERGQPAEPSGCGHGPRRTRVPPWRDRRGCSAARLHRAAY
jgi:class 3 adenylate cyclase